MLRPRRLGQKPQDQGAGKAARRIAPAKALASLSIGDAIKQKKIYFTFSEEKEESKYNKFKPKIRYSGGDLFYLHDGEHVLVENLYLYGYKSLPPIILEELERNPVAKLRYEGLIRELADEELAETTKTDMDNVKLEFYAITDAAISNGLCLADFRNVVQEALSIRAQGESPHAVLGKPTPAALQTKRYKQDGFPPELLKDYSAFKEAERMCNAYNHRKRKGELFAFEETEAYLVAKRFVGQATPYHRPKPKVKSTRLQSQISG